MPEMPPEDGSREIVLVESGKDPFIGDPLHAGREAVDMAGRYVGAKDGRPGKIERTNRDEDRRGDGLVNKNVRVWDMKERKHVTVPEDKIDYSRHALDANDNSPDGGGVEAAEGVKMSKNQFLELVSDARISSRDAEMDPEKKTKKVEARKQLGIDGINVRYITAGDIRGNGDPEKDARRERNREVNILMSAIEDGSITEVQRKFLIGENIGLTQERLDDWEVVVEIRVDERPEQEEPVNQSRSEELRPEAGRNREKIETFIRTNEKKLFNVLIKDWDESLLDPSRLDDRVMLRGMLALSDDVPEGLGEDYREIFKVARSLYLREMLGKRKYSDILGISRALKVSEEKTDDVDTIGRERLTRAIQTAVGTVISDRGWETRFLGESEEMSKKLAIFLESTYNKSEKNGSKEGFDLIFKTFKYSYDGNNRVIISKEEMDKQLLNGEKRELINSVSTVRNLARALDVASSFENLNKDFVAADGAIKKLINLEHPRHGKMIPKIMEFYIYEMKVLANANINSGVDIDSKEVKTAVENRLARAFGPEEVRLYSEMARDMIRITGMDAEFFIPKSGVGDPIKPERGGAFLSGAINFEQKIKTKYSALGGLVDSVDFGVVPFWRKIEGNNNKRYWNVLKHGDIVNLINNNFEGLAYTGWINSFEGVVGAQKIEEDFLKNPTIENFVNNLPKAYGYKKEKAKEYLQERLGGLLTYLLTLNKEYTSASLKKIVEVTFLKDGHFDGKGVFDDMKQLAYFTSKKGVSISLAQARHIENKNRATRRGEKVGDFITKVTGVDWLLKKFGK